MSIEKVIHGDLEATSKGEMLSAGNPQSGAAGYVALELVTGVLAGRRGSFALQHSGTMSPATGSKMEVIVTPGSGTGELTGLTGQFVITVANGHSYDFAYTLPEIAK